MSENMCTPDLFKIEDGVLIEFLGKDLELDCVDIPAEVKAVGDGAFSYSKMKRVRFLGDTESIGKIAFMDCENLESVDLPESLRQIDPLAFSYCDSLERMTVPGGVKHLDVIFSHCRSLSEVVISEGVEEMDESILDCSGVERLSIPASVKEIHRDAFEGAKHLREISIAEDNPCFMAVGGVLYSKDGKTLVCAPRNITEADIPDGVERIENYAFQGCTDLAAVRIPGTVKEIGKYAFEECDMEKIVVPASVTKIEEGVLCWIEEFDDGEKWVEKTHLVAHSIEFENPSSWNILQFDETEDGIAVKRFFDAMPEKGQT